MGSCCSSPKSGRRSGGPIRNTFSFGDFGGDWGGCDWGGGGGDCGGGGGGDCGGGGGDCGGGGGCD